MDSEVSTAIPFPWRNPDNTPQSDISLSEPTSEASSVSPSADSEDKENAVEPKGGDRNFPTGEQSIADGGASKISQIQPRDAIVNRRSQERGGKDPIKDISFSNSEDQNIKLHESPNPWRPLHKCETPLDEKNRLKRTVLGVLNKLTTQKFNTLLSQLKGLNINTDEKLALVINLIFEKAINEPKFSVPYANLCKYLALANIRKLHKNKREPPPMVNNPMRAYDPFMPGYARAVPMPRMYQQRAYNPPQYPIMASKQYLWNYNTPPPQNSNGYFQSHGMSSYQSMPPQMPPQPIPAQPQPQHTRKGANAIPIIDPKTGKNVDKNAEDSSSPPKSEKESITVPASGTSSDQVSFRKLLLAKCQKEFERVRSHELKNEEKMKTLEAAHPDEKKELQLEYEEKKKKIRYRQVGNIRFIGELFKLGMLIEPIMHECIKTLLRQGDEESLECVSVLLKTIGKELDAAKATKNSRDNQMDMYFALMKLIVDKRLTSSRVRFMLQDVIDLKKNKWVPRRDKNNPKTVDQIHKHAESEAREQQQVYQNMTNYPKRISDDRDQRINTGRMGPSEDGWTSSSKSSKGSYSMVDPSKLKLTKPDEVESILLGPGGSGLQSWGRGSSDSTKTIADSDNTAITNRFSALSVQSLSTNYEGRRGSQRSAASCRESSRGRNSQLPPAIRKTPSTSKERENLLETVKGLTRTSEAKAPKAKAATDVHVNGKAVATEGRIGLSEDGWTSFSKNSKGSYSMVDPSKLKLAKPDEVESIRLGPGGRRLQSWGRGRSSLADADNTALTNVFSKLSEQSLSSNYERRGGSEISEASSRESGHERENQLPPANIKTSCTSKDGDNFLEIVKGLIRTSEDTAPEVKATVDFHVNRKAVATEELALSDPGYNEEDMERKTKRLIDEFLHNNDFEGAIKCVTDMASPNTVRVFFNAAINQVLERSGQARYSIGQLLFSLLKKKIITFDQCKKGFCRFAGIFEVIDDYALDIPLIYDSIGEIMEPMIEDIEFFSKFLKEVMQPCLPSEKADMLLASILHCAAKRKGTKKFGEVWRESSLQWTDIIGTDRNAAEFLEKHKLQFIVNPTKVNSQTQMSMEKMKKPLLNLLEINAELEEVFDWVDANVSDTSGPPFVRALVTAVHENCLSGSGTTWKLNTSKLKSRIPLISRYVSTNEKLQLQALYAVQSLMNQLGQPSGLLHQIFDVLYDDDVISDESFIEWEKSDDPDESEGKIVALHSVKSFLSWVREPEEETDEMN